jgi:transposase
MDYKIETSIEIKNKHDLNKLKKVKELTNMGKVNYSEIARDLGIDRRTVKKYYNQEEKQSKKPKSSTIDEYYILIKKLLSEESKQLFSYKSHLYRYLQRELGLTCTRSNFNYYINKHKEFAEYFKPKSKAISVRTETPFGKQAQFDWKERLNFEFTTGEKIVINVGSLVLSASRFKVWMIYLSVSFDCITDFLTKAFELIGGVPEELVIDNASTMMIKPRTQKCKGTINPRFEQFSNDFGFSIKPCIAGRPQTKAKVENPNRIIEEILNYNGTLNDISELHKKLEIITNETNSRICQATGVPPIAILKKDIECLLPIPNEVICNNYKLKASKIKVNKNSLISYGKSMFSVPVALIGKIVTVQAIEDTLYIYYNKNLITVHKILENKKVNYLPEHHLEIYSETFENTDDVKEFAKKHLEEMEQFCEQLQ